MANYKISDLTSIGGSIDRTTDVIPVVDISANQTKKATVNQLLSITGNPVGDTDSQTISNKTLGNTNILTIKDSTNLTIQNSADTTKQARIDASGITTGTTRTYALPDANTTLVGTGTTQTLTNKTLTSPVINTATIANPTLTVDSIAGYSSAATSAVAGLTITSGVIQTANSVPNSVLSNTGTFSSAWALTNWSPSWTNLNVGNGTLNYAKYTQIGKTIYMRLKFTFGTTTSITGNVSVSLPIALNSDFNLSTDHILCTGDVVDSGSATYPCVLRFSTASTVGIYCMNASGTYLTQTTAQLAAAVPVALGTGDGIQFVGVYDV